MRNLAYLNAWVGLVGGLVACLSLPGQLYAQPAKASEPRSWTTQQDHQDMLKQLGITRLRPGPSGQPGSTNSANYDPAKANPYPDLPELLRLENGQKVTTAEQWWKQRRAEIDQLRHP